MPGRSTTAAAQSPFAAVLVLALAVLMVACTSNKNDSSSEADNIGAAGASPENPHPTGTAFEAADWTITLSGLRRDATEEVIAADPWAENPAQGSTFAIYTIESVYNGAGSSALGFDVTFGLWVDGAFYLQCPATPSNSVYLEPEVSSGGMVTGIVCIEVPADADQIVGFVELHDDARTRAFASLEATGPEEQPTDGSTSQAPLPAGSSVEIANWTITPSDLQLNPEAAIDEYDLWGELPPGRQLAIYTVHGVYDGSGLGDLGFDTEVGVWVDGAFYRQGCEVYFDDDIAVAPEVEAGGATSGTACSEVPDDLTDIAEALFFIRIPDEIGGPIYFIEAQ